ncbi:MAG: PLP-dependent transferase [Coriobacteriales bacterium]|nr:PLP-dependent transferase [Coriobacteriales bacterium]
MDSTLAKLCDLRASMGDDAWRTRSDVAQVVANYLRCHPHVEEVRYPGLKQDPLFNEAARTLVGGFGPLVRFCVLGQWHELVCEPCDAKELVCSLERTLAP